MKYFINNTRKKNTSFLLMFKNKRNVKILYKKETGFALYTLLQSQAIGISNS